MKNVSFDDASSGDEHNQDPRLAVLETLVHSLNQTVQHLEMDRITDGKRIAKLESVSSYNRYSKNLKNR